MHPQHDTFRTVNIAFNCQFSGKGDRDISAPVITEYSHRVDSDIESLLREIIGSKNFALINLSLNFCETTIYGNKVFLQNLVSVQ